MIKTKKVKDFLLISKEFHDVSALKCFLKKNVKHAFWFYIFNN